MTRKEEGLMATRRPGRKSTFYEFGAARSPENASARQPKYGGRVRGCQYIKNEDDSGPLDNLKRKKLSGGQ
jgi:hypothetical protein